MNLLIQARHWTVAVAAAALALVLFALSLRLPVRPPAAYFGDLPALSSGQGLRVSWSGNRPGTSVAEAAQLMDPTPLFLPTALSVGAKRTNINGIADKFPALTPERALKFVPGDLRIDQLPPPVAMPADPAAALAANPPGNLAMGFGRSDQATLPLPARQAWVQITSPATGQVVLRAALPAGAASNLPGSNWAPVLFSATVNATGLVGSVVLMPAPPAEDGFLSLDAETAQQLANYLESTMEIGQRLAPGFYRISIGP